MKILGLETSTEFCSVALGMDGHVVERSQLADHTHAELILPMVASLLAEAGIALAHLDVLAFGRGPGGFTGVRVAAAMAQGLAYGADLPVVPVSDLLALAAAARHAHGSGNILSCVDARMGEVYWCAYHGTTADDRLSACMPEQLDAADALKLPEPGPWFGAGSGFGAYGENLKKRLGGTLSGFNATLRPAAKDIVALAPLLVAQGQTVTADAALPVYLRDRVATPSAKL